MDGNLSDMLQGVLQDPDTMEKLMGVAQGLMGSSAHHKEESTASPSPVTESSPPSSQAKDGTTLSQVSSSLQAGNKERIALICALRPYLSPERRQTADSLIKMLNMLKLADLNKLFKE